MTDNSKWNQYMMEYHQKHPETKIYWQTKGSAQKRDLEFSITKEDIIIPETCPYLNIPLNYTRGRGRIDINNNPSIDRIDNTKGYVKGNVQVISNLANRMKSNASLEELVTFARNVLKIHDD